jgi:hypothetical protein
MTPSRGFSRLSPVWQPNSAVAFVLTCSISDASPVPACLVGRLVRGSYKLHAYALLSVVFGLGDGLSPGLFTRTLGSEASTPDMLGWVSMGRLLARHMQEVGLLRMSMYGMSICNRVTLHEAGHDPCMQCCKPYWVLHCMVEECQFIHAYYWAQLPIWWGLCGSRK